MEIASAFGSLRAYHFQFDEDLGGPCAFLEVFYCTFNVLPGFWPLLSLQEDIKENAFVLNLNIWLTSF